MIPKVQARRPAFATVLALFLILAMLLPLPAMTTLAQPAAASPEIGQAAVKAPIQMAALAQAPAQTNTITLEVISARTEPRAFGGAGVLKGDPVSNYEFIINVDNTGDPFDTTDCFAFTDPPTNTVRNPNYPDGCDWPGVRTVPGWSPIYTQGNQDDLNGTASITLPDGKYLISVQADGYKVDGQHFSLPMDEPGLVTVEAQPLPLPIARMVIEVFEDNAMTNGQFDAPGEHGLAGFRTLVNDTVGEITVDIFGNPICSDYERDEFGNLILDAEGNGTPIPGTGGACYSKCYAVQGGVDLGWVDPLDDHGRCPLTSGETASHPFPWVASIPDGLDVHGKVLIEPLGPLRYDVLMVPPDGTDWVQTTTLEGSNGWDTWLQEAGTGLDNEFVVAGEPFPWTIFGWVDPTPDLPPAAGNGSISGVIMGTSTYIPSQNGLPHLGDIWGGLMGTKLEEPIAYPYLALNSLQQGDQAIWVGRGNADGSFNIPNVPPGDYSLTYWDDVQFYILDFVQLSVQPNKVTDVGVRTMVGWFARYFGHVFLDNNENGRRDPGEQGVPDIIVVMRDRDNTEIDRMSISSTSDATGFWELEKGYPMTFWMVLEAYSDLYYTTGVTFQASNQPEETTILGAGVDVSILPILSQWARLDWGVKAYEPGTNGGIAGTVSLDLMRAEDDAAYAGAEPYQPGIPDLTIELWEPVPCTGASAWCSDDGLYELAPDGSYAKGALLNSIENENYIRPKDCVVRDVNGDPVEFPSMPPSTGGYDCLEAPLTGAQLGTEYAELPGNFGFGEIWLPELGATGAVSVPIPPGNYLVEVVIPDDPVFGRPLYTPTREEDVNIYEGDEFYFNVAPPACAGPLHIVDVMDSGTDGYELPWAPGEFSTPIENPGYVEAGGSRFEGQVKPLCNVKLVQVTDQKSVAPVFTLWTEVPVPGRWRGYIVDDLNLATDPLNLTFGEKMGLEHLPVGIYDFTGRLVDTVWSDYHGVFEELLPSDGTFDAPTPSGILPSIYYMYGNDPGQPGSLNVGYNPQYRSIGTSFEVYPGAIMPVDLAPIQNGVGIWTPGAQQTALASCTLEDTTPQIFRVDTPVKTAGVASTLTISGLGFGAQGPQSRVTLRTTVLTPVSWTDREIVATIPASMNAGAYQLEIRADNGQTTVNGLTIHLRGTGYNPPLFEVGPAMPYDTIQSAIDAAAGPTGNGRGLVVVYPGSPTPFTNPTGIWFENPIIYSPIKLQGVGPGGVYPEGGGVIGTVIDGRAMGGDTPYVTTWRTTLGDIWLNRGGWDPVWVDGDGNPVTYEGQVITVFASDGEFVSNFPTTIDGLTIQGGDQQGVPANLDQNGGGIIPGIAPQVVIQGGGIFVNGYARYMHITNNVIRSNGGAYAGAIRVGTPHVATPPLNDFQNDNLLISDNRILANGSTNLAGAIGLFNGTENYQVTNNDLCGNFSAEYGGGLSHYGYSPGGSIHHNRIYFNQSYDEGGGIMIAGELPADPNALSPGAGPVNVYANQIQANLANDDGGGLRFLMAGDFPFNVYNNMIVNNISTHEGGGISLNDAPDVRIYNNTIMKNITTATAATSNGLPAPAGLSTSLNSDILQATLPAGDPVFSDPIVFNNVFWDNRAGTWTGGGVAGIGLQGDPNPIYHWDLGVADSPLLMSPTSNLLQVAYAGGSGNIVGQDPLVVEEYDVTVFVYPWRGNTAFIGANIVAIELPPNLLGDYHLTMTSPAHDAGIASYLGIAAPNQDFERQPRPINGAYDIGADELPLAFPAAAVLYPPPAAAAAAQAQAPAQGLPFVAYLPLIFRSGGEHLSEWGGNTESFVLDPAGGVDVASSGSLYWQQQSFAQHQETYLTFTGVANDATRQDLLLKIGGLTAEGQIGPDTYLLDIGYDATQDTLSVSTLSPGGAWTTQETFGGIGLAAGDMLGARSSPGGIVELFLNGILVGRVDLSAGESPWSYYADGGWLGVWFEGPDFAVDPARFTDFGGGSLD